MIQVGTPNIDDDPQHGGQSRGLVVPVSTLKLVDKILKDKDCKGRNVKMAFGESCVMFQCEDVVLFSRLCEGRFPKWRNIIPKKESPMAYAAVNSKQLLTAVKTIQGVTTDRDPGIYVTFVNGRMELMGEGKERGTGKTVVPADCWGRATFKIDPTVLSRMLATLDNTTIDYRLQWRGCRDSFSLP